MVKCDDEQMKNFLAFINNAPEDQELIDMDCNDHCENLARLAEQVASGEFDSDLLPRLEQYMHYWGDCREEFEALVALLRAEKSGEVSAPDSQD